MRREIMTVGIIYLMLLAVGVGVGAFIHHKRSMASFAVDIPQGSTVRVYADQGGDGPFQYDATKPLFRLGSDQVIKTKVGVYDFVIDGKASDYATVVTKTTINKATQRVVINPDFSQTKLQSELASEKNQILTALNTKFGGGVETYYTVSKVTLYKHGEWAGVMLQPKSDQYDPVRLVLTKKSGRWTVVNEPAIFVIGSLYTNIPPDVVADINAPAE